MKQFKKLSALVLALGMMCSVMVPASAANDPMNLRSDHAGTTRTVVVVTGDFEGNTGEEYMVDVTVPADATKAEELALIESSARRAAGMPTPRTPTLAYTLSHTGGWTLIAAGNPSVVGEGMLPNGWNFSALAVTFDNVTGYNGASRLNARVSNNHHGSNSYASSSLRLGSYTLVTLLTGGGGDSQGGEKLYLNDGDYITVRASVDSGSAYVGDVYVSAGSY